METVREHVIPDLYNLAGLGYVLDLVIATHIDADHISGLLHLFKANGTAFSPQVIEIRDVWHNSLRAIRQIEDPLTAVDSHRTSKWLSQGDRDILMHIRDAGYPTPPTLEDNPSEISARQGSSLAVLLLRGKYRWNGGSGEIPITCLGSSSRHVINATTYLTILGPTPSQLRTLSTQWVRDLRRAGFSGTIGDGELFEDAFEFLTALDGDDDSELDNAIGQQISGTAWRASNATLAETYLPDRSATNASSISCIVQSGPYSVLFLADGWADDVEQALREYARSEQESAEFPLLFDAIKVSHHGSHHNTSPSLLEVVDSPCYLIATDGRRHSHPDFEVLKAIVDRTATFRRDLYFSYVTPASTALKAYTSSSLAPFSVYEGVQDIVLQDAISENSFERESDTDA